MCPARAAKIMAVSPWVFLRLTPAPAFTSDRAIGLSPSMAAIIRAVQPSSKRWFTSAPCSNNTLT